ncbi:MAG: response regulator [Candidatus Electrothrix sp. ATG2]|nr:response regulator [Candidatus Electrothrix sp. ATG2]
MNLVHNGAEAIDGAGKILLVTSVEQPDKDTSISHRLAQTEHVVLRVHDTGVGISEENLPHIFEPFYTKKKMGRSGTGLGLTVVWNTMEDHNGAVTVTSTGQETSFSLYFPVSVTNEKQKTISRQASVVPTGHGEFILVVDDESVQRDVASNMLEELGYHVETVQSGEEAIAILHKKKVDLLLLDMLMAPGMNGCQTYEQIRKIHPGQRAIIASGYSEHDEVRKARQLGASHFLKKPYSINTLGRAVHEALTDTTS